MVCVQVWLEKHLSAFSLLLVTLTVPILSVQFVPIDQGPDSWWAREFPGLTDSSLCPVLSDPAHGKVTVNGHLAVYSCETNYTLVAIGLDDNRRPCVEGEWLGDDAIECKRNGDWSVWSDWTQCSVSCGGGQRRRSRECTEPPPEPGGKDCPGKAEETISCNPNVCPKCTIQHNITVAGLTVGIGPTGDFIEFSCPSGFRVEGNKTQSCANFDTVTITSECVRECPQLDNIMNGTVEYINPERTLARYLCVVGFSLAGSQERSCVDGVWTGSEPECFKESFEDQVEPLGANPLLGLPEGTIVIDSTKVLVSQCNASLTFNLRTRTTLQSSMVKIRADLVLLNFTDGEVETEPVASAALEELESTTTVCLTLQCRVDPASLQLPRVGRVRLTVTLQGGAEVSNIDFADGRPCDAFVDDVNSTCDGSTASGDCGYRNTGCGSVPWTLNANVTDEEEEEEEEEEDDDETTTLVTLQTKQLADPCEFEECIPCSRSSGFKVSSTSQPTTGSTGEKRKRRSFRKESSRLAFCLNSGFAELNLFPQGYQKSPANKYMSFNFKMYRGGTFQSLALYLRCTVGGVSSKIGLGSYRGWYSIAIGHGRGKSGRRCLDLHRNLDYVTASKCKKFYLFVSGIASGNQVCFRGHQFHSQSGPCGNVDNDY